MTYSRALVIALLATGMGVVLGRTAIAQRPRGATPAESAPRPTPSTAPASLGTSQHPDLDDDNPYRDNAPAVASAVHADRMDHPVVRVPVPSKDGMLLIPGGTFTMGAGYSPNGNEPRVRAKLAPYWIDRTEVTVKEYQACVAKGVCERPSQWSKACTYELGDPELPVSCVHWTDADAYCRFAKKRLPGEAEWELAARGMSGGAFPWGGGAACSLAVTMVGAFVGTKSCADHPMKVGSHPAGASVFGVMDMAGNVEEWTSDWYAARPAAGASPRYGAAHVLRGGGWQSAAMDSRTTSRNWGSAMEAGSNVGFRCARDGS